MNTADYSIISEKAQAFKNFVKENNFTSYEYYPGEIVFAGLKTNFTIFLDKEIPTVGRCIALPAEEFLLVLYWLQFRGLFHLSYGI